VVQVSSYKKVKKVVFVESIRRSPAGKILRRLLMDSLRDSNASTGSNSNCDSRR
jgi:4-coumarate--CoA ligase